MIRPQDLRIGNIIDFEDGSTDRVSVNWLFRVEDIWFVNWTKLSGDGGFDCGESLLEDFKPVELSAEILEKAGCLMLSESEFVIARYSVRKQKKLDDPCWEVYLLGNDATFHWIKNIRLLHDFQNLIHALTGTELDVKL